MFFFKSVGNPANPQQEEEVNPQQQNPQKNLQQNEPQQKSQPPPPFSQFPPGTQENLRSEIENNRKQLEDLISRLSDPNASTKERMLLENSMK